MHFQISFSCYEDILYQINMARKKVELFIDIHNEKEFENALDANKDKLICAEIYCGFFGSCPALDRLFAKIKMEWGVGEIVLLKVLSDEIEALSRLHNQSQPFYMFIVNRKVTQIFRGIDCMRFEEVAKKELDLYRKEKQGFSSGRLKYEIDEPTPIEMDWLLARAAEKQLETQKVKTRHEDRQAVRKRHRSKRMAPCLEDLDFVLYWPHATCAHPELYERWDENNCMMIAREEITLTKEMALDILYSGDAPINEASLHALLSGPALAICLRCLDPVDMVSLVRRILYEDIRIPPEKEAEKRKSTAVLPISAYEYYKTFSPTQEQILKKRREERAQMKLERKDNRIRYMKEMQRLAQQARAEAIEAKKAAKEQKKMELLKAGKVAELDALKAEPDDTEDVDIEIPEEQSYVSEESETEDDPEEYFPPPGLPIPGFYSPPNDIAKANGLHILFPNVVQQRTSPPPEFLPPHVLVMLHMYKRHKAIQHMAPFKYGIIHMGIFKGNIPFHAKHVAYSVKQFEAMNYEGNLDDLKLCFMVSTKVDVPLLELMDFSPLHVSRHTVAGEDECAALFRVDYGDEYPEFEDFDADSDSKLDDKE